MRSISLGILAIAALLLALPAAAVDITVDPSGSGDYMTIADALAVANPGDRILVSAGTYTERNLALKSDVAIIGAGPDVTIMDADGVDRHFYATIGITGWSIEGMTLTNGHVTAASPITDKGGSIHMANDGVVATIDNCVFSYNASDDAGGAIASGGLDSSLTITNSIFVYNTSVKEGAVIRDDGGTEDQPGATTVVNCVFTDNSSPDNSAVIHCVSDDGTVVSFINCLIARNSTNNKWILRLMDQITVQNCTIVDNYAAKGGVLADITQTVPLPGTTMPFVKYQNNIIANNVVEGATGNSAIFLWKDPSVPRSETTITNNLMYNNTAVDGLSDDGQTPPFVSIWRNGNMEGAPLFVSDTDYHLSSELSPAVDAGATIAGLSADLEGNARPQGGAFDIGAYESPFTAPPPAPVPAAGGLGLFITVCALGAVAAFRRK